MSNLFEKIDFNRILKYTLYLFLTLLAQNMVIGNIRIFGISPMVLPAAVVAVGMFEGPVFGAVFGLVMGFFADMSFVENSVFFTLLLPVLAFGSAFVSQFFINRRFFAYMGLTLLALFLASVLQMVKTLAADVWCAEMFTAAVIQTLWSLPFSVPAYFPPDRWNK